MEGIMSSIKMCISNMFTCMALISPVSEFIPRPWHHQEGTQVLLTGLVYSLVCHMNATMLYLHFDSLQEMPLCVQISYVFYCFRCLISFIKIKLFVFRVEIDLALCIFTCIFQINGKLNFAKMSVRTFKHSHDDMPPLTSWGSMMYGCDALSISSSGPRSLSLIVAISNSSKAATRSRKATYTARRGCK